MLAAVLTAMASIWYQGTYYTWPGFGASGRLHWCGRDYELLSGSPQTWRQISGQQTGRIHAIGLYPPFSFDREQLLSSTDLTPGKLPAGVCACTTVLYVRAAPNQYQTYSLLGGP